METWLAQNFVHAEFVPWGTALVAAPILIHLINRLRFRVVRFAAMEFLLQSERRNRRRVLLEQVLLLLARILIVLCIVMLIARLILDPLQLSLLRGAKSHHVVLLDDSGSMRDRSGERTAFDAGLEIVRKLVAEGSRRPGTQKLSLLLLSAPNQPVCSERDVDEVLVNELGQKLGTLRCTHRSLDVASGLNAVQRLLEPDRASVKHLHVVSDFRQADWLNQKAFVGSLRALHASGVSLNMVFTTSIQHQNLSVVQLTGDVHVATAGVPVRLKVAVKNFSDQVANNVRLTVLQDRQKLPLTVQFDTVEAGATVDREFDLTFDVAGSHQVEVVSPADSLSEDNSRFLALEIATVNEILIIEGHPGSEEGQYVADALAAAPRITGHAPRIETVDYLRKRPLDGFQSIFLLNVADLPADALAPLEEYVAAGGGLAWFLGDLVNPGFYNANLYRDGTGVFPVPLAKAPRTLPPPDGLSTGPDLILTDHPVFRVFSGVENPYINASRVYKYFPAADDWIRDDQERGDQCKTIVRLRNQQPVLLEHRFGSGRVVACLTSCGPAWNNWALYASYVVLQLELQKYVARTDRLPPQRVVGEPIRQSLAPSEFTETVEITTPELAGQHVIRLKAAPESDVPGSQAQEDAGTPVESPQTSSNQTLPLVASYADTDTPGVYSIKTFGHSQNVVERHMAYNFPAEESDLAITSSRQLRQWIGLDLPLHIQESGDLSWIGGQAAGQEVRNWLLALLLFLLLSEQALAYRMSHHGQSDTQRTQVRVLRPRAEAATTNVTTTSSVG